jgi:hypothetical protein
MNGRNSCSMIFQTMSKDTPTWPPAENSRATRAASGKSRECSTVEAAQIAAGTLPPAIEVKAIDDCTVDGRDTEEQQAEIEWLVDQPGREETQSETEQREDRERRDEDEELQAPVQETATTTSVERRAPCRKNRRAMAMLVATPNHSAAAPEIGSRDARRTAPMRSQVKVSGRRRFISCVSLRSRQAGIFSYPILRCKQ